MNVSATKVSTQPQTNLEKTAKVAAGVAASCGLIEGEMLREQIVSGQKILKDSFSYELAKEKVKDILNTSAEKNYRIRLEREELKKEIEVLSKFDIRKKPAEVFLKLMEKIENGHAKYYEEYIETVKNLNPFTRKPSLNFLIRKAKTIAKNSLIAGGIAGGGYLVGKTIADHIQAKKAQ